MSRHFIRKLFAPCPAARQVMVSAVARHGGKREAEARRLSARRSTAFAAARRGGKHGAAVCRPAALLPAALLVVVLFFSAGCSNPRPLADVFNAQAVEAAAVQAIDDFNVGDYEAIIARGDELFRNTLTPEAFAAAVGQYVSDLGSFESIERLLVSGQKDVSGNDLALVVAVGNYENRRMIFLIGFNASMELVQFYIQ